jgi:hypothetical protein
MMHQQLRINPSVLGGIEISLVVRVTGFVQPVLQVDKGEGPFWIDVDDLKHFAVVRQ